MNVNRVIVIGGVTRDPDARATTSGLPVMSFSIATNRKEGEKERTEFHNIVAFGKLAESAMPYLKRGMTAFVEGHLQTRMWEADGRKNYRTEIVAERIKWVFDKPKEEAKVGEPKKPQEEIEPEDW